MRRYGNRQRRPHHNRGNWQHDIIQQLESRCLLAATLLADINAAEFRGGTPFRFVPSDDYMYFTASTSTTGRELWRTDGSDAQLVKDLAPGIESSSPTSLVNVGEELFFIPSDPKNIWRTDGTELGTQVFYEGSSIQYPLYASADKFFFVDYDGTHSFWVSDGTPAGTDLLGNFGHVRELLAIGDTVYFSADGESGTGLFKTDGTSAGTTFVKPFSGYGNFPGLMNLAEFHGELYFFGDDGSVFGEGLWRSNGTPAGTVPVKTLASRAEELTVVNDTLYFTSGHRVWKSDGTETGTSILSHSPSLPFFLTDVAGTLFFRGRDAHGNELWKSNGTEAGTVRVTDIDPDSDSVQSILGVIENEVFFTAHDGQRQGLWKSDGSSNGTIQLSDALSHISEAAIWRDKLYFRARENSGDELWVTDGMNAGISRIDIESGSAGSSVLEFETIHDSLFFSARDEESWGVWKSVAGSGSVQKLANVPGSNLTNVAGRAFFSNGNTLWKSDGSIAGTVPVKEFGGRPDEFYAFGNTLYFRAGDGIHGRELWKSDGTEVGTVMVKDIAPGDAASHPRRMVSIDDTLYFDAFHPASGFELWKTDGTENGTVLVKDIAPGNQNSVPAFLTDLNGTLFFSAHQAGRPRLWKSDGSEAGTVQVKDLDAGWLRDFVVLNGVLYFFDGAVLWKSDGTESGTTIVKDTGPGTNLLSNLVVANDLLYFTADDGVTGRELWKSDGTPAGTKLLVDIYPGPRGSNPDSIVNSYGTLFFSANDGVHGREVWTSDGTPEGTVMVTDIAAIGESAPEQFTVFANTVVFTATTEEYGDEIWTVTNESADGTPPVATVRALSSAGPQLDVEVDLADPNGIGPSSGVDSWDLFVARDDGPWSAIATGLPASQSSVVIGTESHRRYWFRAVARDKSGNTEFDQFLSEATVLTGDVAPPVSIAQGVSSNSTGLVTVNMSGSDAGNSGLQDFEVLVSIDGGELMPAAPSAIPAGNPVDGIYSALVEYQALRDSTLHTYDFFVIGIDGAGNRENIPETADATISVMADPADPLEATAIDIQQQTTQRSFVQFADIAFNDTNGLMDLIDNGRVAVERFALDDATPAIGTGLPVTGFSASVAGNSIRLDFGSTGLGGAGHLGNGFYRILLDMDGDGVLGDAHFEFFRLYGDANGDGKVDRNDRRVTEDLTGDRIVTSADRRLFRSEGRRGDSLLDELFALLDD